MSAAASAAAADNEFFAPPPSLLSRWMSLPVFAYSLAALLGLVSYEWTDIASLNSAATSANWVGMAGAWNSWLLLLGLGLAAYLMPLFGFAAAALLAMGRRVGWRAAWFALFVVASAGLMQFANSFVAPLLEGGRLNIAPNSGGGIGWLVADSSLKIWLGPGGAAAILAVALLLALVMMIGPAAISDYFFTLRNRGIEAERQFEEAVAEGESPEEARKRVKEAERQKRLAEKLAATEARDAEKARQQGIRELEKAAKLARKEEERQQRDLEKAEEKARRLAEREARQAAATAAKEAARELSENEAREQADEAARQLAAAAAREQTERDARAEAIAAAAANPSKRQPEPPAPKTPIASPFVSDGVDYSLPKPHILAPIPKIAEDAGAEAEIAENISIIQNTLNEFGISVEVTGVIRGPAITCYEVKPPPGIKIDRISSYSNDLQMKLEATSLRILSPIPGKSVMGIEVPNKKKRAVLLREIVESGAWQNAMQTMALPMLLGMNISGEPVIADLAKMPHILVAGATGSGKSVCLNSIMAGFLLSRTPENLRLMMVDPKMVEFTPYSDLPHLVVPIITAPKKVAAVLQWSIVEMKRRLTIFKQVGVRNIASFNTRDLAKQATLFNDDDDNPPVQIPEKLPYIVIVIDEMADLMMAAQKEVEPRIASLAQLSRAVGIHMILATQRPSVNVITGLIKANFPARIAFKVSQRVDSQTILDSKGAENLIGQGDMLFNNPSGILLRAQGAWISDKEVVDLVDWFKKQGAPVYVEEIKNKLDKMVVKPEKDEYDDEDDDEAPGDGLDERDADTKVLRAALEVIVKTQRASTSGLQRALRLGYTRAARVMDELERRGCIGPPVGPGGQRDILRTYLGDDDGDNSGGGDGGDDGEEF